MKAERDKIEAERAENQKMMQELLLMKEKLSQASGISAVTAANTVASAENSADKAVFDTTDATADESAVKDKTTSE